MPPDQALSSTLIGSNYPCLELIFLVPKVFEPLKFDCNDNTLPIDTSELTLPLCLTIRIYMFGIVLKGKFRLRTFKISTVFLNHQYSPHAGPQHAEAVLRITYSIYGSIYIYIQWWSIICTLVLLIFFTVIII